MKKLGRPTEERRDLWNIIADNNFSINGQNGLTLVIENVNSGPDVGELPKILFSFRGHIKNLPILIIKILKLSSGSSHRDQHLQTVSSFFFFFDMRQEK